jgi:hypothetical protein
MTRVDRCDRCRFWERDEPQPDEKTHPEDAIGRCHRRAPWPFASEWWYEMTRLLAADKPEEQTITNGWEEACDRGSTSWAPTHANDWCGEFEETPHRTQSDTNDPSFQ